MELIDSYFLDIYKDVNINSNSTINTESPHGPLTGFSILILKIYHMQQEAQRTDASAEHISACQAKLDILLEQRTDLSTALNNYWMIFREAEIYEVYNK